MEQGSFQSDDGAFLFVFASHLIGRPLTEEGRRIGRVRDILVRRRPPYPELAGLVITTQGREHFLPISKIQIMGLVPGQPIVAQSADIVPQAADKALFSVRQVLMDKQIVDVEGAKVKRVNDVHLLLTREKAFLVHVDVGFSGILRRLGFEREVGLLAQLFGKKLKDELISWKHVMTLEEGFGPGTIRLAAHHDQLPELHPGELADILEDLSQNERLAILHSVDVETSANALEEVEPELGAAIMEDLDPELAADIMEEMEPAVAVDILNEVEETQRVAIKRHMEADERQEIEQLEHFHEETAGGLMSTDFLAITPDKTVADALTLIRESARDVDLIYYVFLIDDAGRLGGVVGIRNLLCAEPTSRLADLPRHRTIAVKPEDDWKEVAEMFYKYSFFALPVVDHEEKLLGVIGFRHCFDELIPYYAKEAAA
jgi:CBS domain-containing protein